MSALNNHGEQENDKNMTKGKFHSVSHICGGSGQEITKDPDLPDEKNSQTRKIIYVRFLGGGVTILKF